MDHFVRAHIYLFRYFLERVYSSTIQEPKTITFFLNWISVLGIFFRVCAASQLSLFHSSLPSAYLTQTPLTKLHHNLRQLRWYCSKKKSLMEITLNAIISKNRIFQWKPLTVMIRFQGAFKVSEPMLEIQLVEKIFHTKAKGLLWFDLCVSNRPPSQPSLHSCLYYQK